MIDVLATSRSGLDRAKELIVQSRALSAATGHKRDRSSNLQMW
jgi:hypothetical protein